VREEVVEQPPPKRPLLWPWLLLLLALVIGGIAAAYFLTRDSGSTTPRVPNVVGVSTTEAVAKLGQRGYPAVVRSIVNRSARPGTVISQRPTSGTKLDRGSQVTIMVARGPGTVDVPNVVGLPVDQAFVRLQSAGLKGRSVQVASKQPKGRVIKQAPPSGAQAKKGSAVLLTVSKGPSLVAVPSVKGMTEAEATATLTRLGFRVKVSRVHSTAPTDTVVSQQPRAGIRVPKGSIAGINVSNGPATTTTGTTTTTPTGVALPNVVNMSQRDAVAAIERAGFGVDSYPVASSRPRGTVVAQRPAAGTRVSSGDRMRIDVALGSGERPLRVVPDVIGQSETAARQTLIAAGFTFRTVYKPIDPNQQGLVVDQRPASGQQAQAGTQVIIDVGRLAG
jgi:eukaryotic-like serine/threonine-protein kinase